MNTLSISRLIKGGALLLCLGCGPCDVPGSGGGDSDGGITSLVSDFAPSTLPFDVDPGLERMRGLYRMPALSNSEHVEDEPGLLIGVAASTEHAVVAFPAAERAGYDIAYAAAREPWARAELNDLDVEDVGAVVATQAPDGEVWFAFRGRRGPHTINLWRWRPGGVPERVEFARVAPAQLSEHLQSCPDIDLTVSADGVDLVYRQSEREVRHAHLAPGERAWEDTSVVTLSEAEGHDIGCALRLDYDEGGVPNVLAWVRQGSTQGASESVEANTLMGQGRGWFRSHTGAWLPAGYFYDTGVGPRPFGVRGTDMVNVGGAHLIVSSIAHSNRTAQSAPVNVVGTGARPWLVSELDGASGSGSAKFIACIDSFSFDSLHPSGGPGYGLSLMRTGVGAVASFHPDEWRIKRMTGCKPHAGTVPVPPRLAPVRQGDTRDVRSPTAARGVRPYDLVVCLNRAGGLEVCAGGIDEDASRVDDSPVHSIVNGWRESRGVPPGQYSVALEIEQESGDLSDPVITVVRLDAAAGASSAVVGESVFAPTRPGDPWQVSFDVQPRARYQVFVGSRYATQDFWRERGLGAVYLHAEVERFDPREPRHHPCIEEDTLDARGVCTTPRQDLYIGESIDLPLNVDLSRGWAPPELYDAEGDVVPTEVVTKEVWEKDKWVELVPKVELEQLSRYEVRYPDGTTNMFGAEYTIDQRIFFVTTRQGPLTLEGSEPEDGATGVELDSIIRVSFSGPVAFYNDGRDFILEQGVGRQRKQIPLTFRERPGNVFELTPERLLPSARHTLTLSDGLRARSDGLQRPLVGAPIVIEFETAAE